MTRREPSDVLTLEEARAILVRLGAPADEPVDHVRARLDAMVLELARSRAHEETNACEN